MKIGNRKQRLYGAIGILALTGFVAVSISAQQPPAGGGAPAGQAPAAPGGGQGRAGGGPGRGAGGGMGADNTRILIVGENPAIQHRRTQGENSFSGTPPATDANFWRVSWSPAGPGAACFITVNDPTPAAQKFVITDNPKLAEYIASKEILERLIPQFNNPPYTVVQGTVTQTTDGTQSRTETCKGGNNTVELKWSGGLQEPRWIDFPFARQFGVIMTISMSGARQHEITINGKRAPGQYASGTLALNETWRVER